MNRILIVLASIIFINTFLLALFCRGMAILEKLLYTHSHKKNSVSMNTEKTECKKVVEKKNLKKWVINGIINFLNSYGYGWMRYCILEAGRIPSNRIRNIIYRVVFNAHITSKTVINGGCEIRSPWNFYAGNCVIMNNCILDARGKIVIHDNVVFGQGVHIWTEEHDVNSSTFSVSEKNRGPVIVENRAWIGSDSTILPGIHIGEGAVLGSRACATKDLDPYGIYVGIPAKKHGERNQKLVYELSGKPHWHFY